MNPIIRNIILLSGWLVLRRGAKNKLSRNALNILVYIYFVYKNVRLRNVWKISSPYEYWDLSRWEPLPQYLSKEENNFICEEIFFYIIEIVFLIQNYSKTRNFYLFLSHHLSALGLMVLVLSWNIPYIYALNVLINHDFLDIFINLMCVAKLKKWEGKSNYYLLETSVVALVVFWPWCRFYNMYFLLNHITVGMYIVNDILPYSFKITLDVIYYLLSFHVLANCFWYGEICQGIFNQIFNRKVILPDV